MDKKSRIAIFASGAGTNAEVLFRYFQHHKNIEVVLLLSNNPNAQVLARAANHNIPTQVFTRTEFGDDVVFMGWLAEKKVTHLVLAGFLWLVPQYLIHAFPDRIINIHPSLLPKYGGKGMYGARVHEAVLQAGEKETGITIHLVNEKFDEGRILHQAKCSVVAGDSAEGIARKIHQLEHEAYPKVIEHWIGETAGSNGNG